MLVLFAVRDVKADCYQSLVVLPTRGLAMRGLVDACADPKSPFRQHAEDYTLYELGTFDETTGEVKGHKLPEYVMSAVEAMAMVRKKEDEFQLPLPGMAREGVK